VTKPVPTVIRDRREPLHAELITVGRDILRGRIQDWNAVVVASQLCLRGAIVHRITTVDDSERAVSAALREALERGAHLVVTTGGLGPSQDDRTLAGVADALQLPLTLHPAARRHVEAAYVRLAQRGVVPTGGLNAAREKMATLPIGSEAIENAEGVAPGVLLRRTGGGAIVCLPGVPDESRGVLDSAMVVLKDLFPPGVSARRDLEAPTPDESTLRPLLDTLRREFPTVWIHTRSSGYGRRRRNVGVCLETFAATSKEAESILDRAFKRLLALAGRD
jgi:molybdopterin-biosynthesis enzyme MoeA-like protein